MRSLLPLLLASLVFGADLKPLLNDKPLPAVAAPTLKEPLSAEWSQAKGKWTPDNGVLHMVEIPEDKHVPVLHHKVGLSAAVIELDFKQDAAGAFYVGCDSDKHVGRVVILGGSVVIQEDSAKASHTVASLKYNAKVGEWHHLRVEWKDDQMACNIDGQELKAQHAYFATAKKRSWLAGSKTADVKNLTINGEKNVEAKK
ncbi:MAG: hypothetical protein WCJ96_07475 [Verrucomicrobiota bacterium]|jgi:hypothetical protein